MVTVKLLAVAGVVLQKVVAKGSAERCVAKRRATCIGCRFVRRSGLWCLSCPWSTRYIVAECHASNDARVVRLGTRGMRGNEQV